MDNNVVFNNNSNNRSSNQNNNRNSDRSKVRNDDRKNECFANSEHHFSFDDHDENENTMLFDFLYLVEQPVFELKL